MRSAFMRRRASRLNRAPRSLTVSHAEHVASLNRDTEKVVGLKAISVSASESGEIP